jgi:hypothetical protein
MALMHRCTPPEHLSHVLYVDLFVDQSMRGLSAGDSGGRRAISW